MIIINSQWFMQPLLQERSLINDVYSQHAFEDEVNGIHRSYMEKFKNHPFSAVYESFEQEANDG